MSLTAGPETLKTGREEERVVVFTAEEEDNGF